MSGCGSAEPCSARAFIHGDADTDGLVVEVGNAGPGLSAIQQQIRYCPLSQRCLVDFT
jgi:hypothetical protein